MNRIPLPLAALAAGAASAFAFEPAGWWPLMILAIAILCELIARAGSLKSALLIGWLLGLGQFTIGLNWIATAFTFQAAMPAWLGWVAVVLLSLYLAIYPAMAAGLAWRFGQKNKLALVLALAGGWAITEWLRATMFTGFAWNPIGVTLVESSARHLSRLVGTYGLSAIAVLLSGALWLACYRRTFTVLAIIAPIALLSASLPEIGVSSGWIYRARIVQPNIGQQDKWRPGFDEEAYRRLYALSIQGPPRPRLIFWPEAAVTEPIEDGRFHGKKLAAGERLRATRPLGPGDVLLTGGLSLTSRDGRTVDGATNSVYVMQPLGKISGRYDKAHLVPYGEYLPMRPLLSKIGLSRLAPGNVDFVPGPGPRSVDLPEGPYGGGSVGMQLCYEIIFSGEVVDRKNPPSFIFNPSNDAWFGRWGPPQHLAQARLRATEEGLSIVRSTPTGISALIAPDGKLLGSIPWQRSGAITGPIWGLLEGPAFPFRAYGNVIPLTLGFLLVIAAIALSRRARYRAI
jgi:apolipoprotein N-acyltransferase